MEISEQDLRAMIREAVARHASGGGAHGVPPPRDLAPMRAHASHGLLVIAASGDGECVIEPSVRCDHCGYCTSLGH